MFTMEEFKSRLNIKNETILNEMVVEFDNYKEFKIFTMGEDSWTTKCYSLDMNNHLTVILYEENRIYVKNNKGYLYKKES